MANVCYALFVSAIVLLETVPEIAVLTEFQLSGSAGEKRAAGIAGLTGFQYSGNAVESYGIGCSFCVRKTAMIRRLPSMSLPSLFWLSLQFCLQISLARRFIVCVCVCVCVRVCVCLRAR